MQKHKLQREGAGVGLPQLASLGGKQGRLDQMLSSHPDPGSRVPTACDKIGGRK